MRTWLDNINGHSKLRLFNNGLPCGPNLPSCDTIDMCPGDNVDVFVMAANMDNCLDRHHNSDSIVTKFTYGGLSILLLGDFQNQESGVDGPLEEMIQYYGNGLNVEVYQASHHGSSRVGNTMDWLEALSPSAIVSGM